MPFLTGEKKPIPRGKEKKRNRIKNCDLLFYPEISGKIYTIHFPDSVMVCGNALKRESILKGCSLQKYI